MPKIVLKEELVDALKLKGKAEMSDIPLSRRQALTFQYGNMDPSAWGMDSLAMMLPHLGEDGAGAVHDKSQVYRKLNASATDSWEIELCVGLAIRLLVLPNWDVIKQLGRALMVLKVHKAPPVCEVFFLRRDQVVATYKDRMPRTLEWVHLYDPEGEVVFWAELYKPSSGQGHNRSSKSSWLTDELCGGFGSRFSLKGHVLREGMLEAVQAHQQSTPEEQDERVAQVEKKIEQKRAKKARQKARKAEEKAVAEEAAKEEAAEKEAEQLAAMRATKIAAPQALKAVDWSSMKKDKEKQPVGLS
jgi:hypothetical protein